MGDEYLHYEQSSKKQKTYKFDMNDIKRYRRKEKKNLKRRLASGMSKEMIEINESGYTVEI